MKIKNISNNLFRRNSSKKATVYTVSDAGSCVFTIGADENCDDGTANGKYKPNGAPSNCDKYCGNYENCKAENPDNYETKCTYINTSGYNGRIANGTEYYCGDGVVQVASMPSITSVSGTVYKDVTETVTTTLTFEDDSWTNQVTNVSQGTYSFARQTGNARNGSYALCSNNYGNNSTDASIEFKVTPAGSGQLCFWYKGESEIYNSSVVDYFTYTLNGTTVINKVGGPSDYATYRQQCNDVTAGQTYTLNFLYHKDVSDHVGIDRFCIDDLTLSGTVTTQVVDYTYSYNDEMNFKQVNESNYHGAVLDANEECDPSDTNLTTEASEGNRFKLCNRYLKMHNKPLSNYYYDNNPISCGTSGINACKVTGATATALSDPTSSDYPCGYCGDGIFQTGVETCEFDGELIKYENSATGLFDGDCTSSVAHETLQVSGSVRSGSFPVKIPGIYKITLHGAGGGSGGKGGTGAGGSGYAGSAGSKGVVFSAQYYLEQGTTVYMYAGTAGANGKQGGSYSGLTGGSGGAGGAGGSGGASDFAATPGSGGSGGSGGGSQDICTTGSNTGWRYIDKTATEATNEGNGKVIIELVSYAPCNPNSCQWGTTLKTCGKRQVKCTKPDNAAFWGSDTIEQTLNGSTWGPSNIGQYSATSTTTPCAFYCLTGDYDSESNMCGTEQDVDCTGKPVNAHWNTAASIHQTWSGYEWTPSKVGVYNEEPSSIECRFACNDGFTYEGGDCINQKTVSCTGLPSNAHWIATGTTAQDITQTWSSSTDWIPDSVGEYAEASAENRCFFQCNDNFTWNPLASKCEGDTQTATCTGLPSNAEWNSGSSTITQTWNGSAWGPTTAGTWNASAVENYCYYKCRTNFHRKGSTCISNTRTDQACSSLTTGAFWNTVDHITQTWTGAENTRWTDTADTQWTPSLTSVYNNSATGTEEFCWFKCGANNEYSGNDTSCQYCGDNSKNGPEACDKGSSNSNAWAGSEAARNCKTDCSGWAPYCGDGNKDTGNEQCDNGSSNSNAWAPSYAARNCKTDCSGDAPYCGDGEEYLSEEVCDFNKNYANAAGAQKLCASRVGGGGRNYYDPGAGKYPTCEGGCAVGNIQNAVDGVNCLFCGDGVLDTANGEQCEVGHDPCEGSTAYYHPQGTLTLDFEDNSWQSHVTSLTQGTYTFTRQTGNAHDGSYALCSNNKGKQSSTAEITFKITPTASGNLCFWYKGESEIYNGTVYDKFTYTLDGTTVINGVGGPTNYANYTQQCNPVVANQTYTLYFKFYKDSSDSGTIGKDIFCIDDLTIPAAVATSQTDNPSTAGCNYETCTNMDGECYGRWCGDGNLDTDEESCDQGAANSDNWANSEATRHCNGSCSGWAPYCGDGNTDAGNEQCDNGTANNSNAWAPSYAARNCKTNCSGDAPYCGDGNLDSSNEQCDNGALNGDDWRVDQHCKADCSGAAPYCGDNIFQAGSDKESCEIVNGEIWYLNISGGQTKIDAAAKQCIASKIRIENVTENVYEGTIEDWTVPKTGIYEIEAYGASGGDGYYSSTTYSGCAGAFVTAKYALKAGQKVRLLAGKRGYQNKPTNYAGGGGGGGSFVVLCNDATCSTPTPLVIAGGGGGGSYTAADSCKGQASTSGGAGYATAATGGANGGNYSTYSYGGRGWNTISAAFIGATPATTAAEGLHDSGNRIYGGFGGGGSGYYNTSTYSGGGGGGGYSGGSAGRIYNYRSGGGGSYINEDSAYYYGDKNWTTGGATGTDGKGKIVIKFLGYPDCQDSCNWKAHYTECVGGNTASCSTGLPGDASFWHDTVEQSWNSTNETWEPETTAHYSTTDRTDGCYFHCNAADYTYEPDVDATKCIHTKPYNCEETGKPEHSAWWHTTITRSWTGSAWTPGTGASHSASDRTDGCFYHCNTNYTINGSSCTADKRTTENCGSKPGNTSWNDGGKNGKFEQTWDENGASGAAWYPQTYAAVYSPSSAAECGYKCIADYHTEDSGASCVSDTRPNTACSGTLPANATWWNGGTYTQTWNGSTWPVVSANYSASSTTAACSFHCNTNYNWNSSECVAATQPQTCDNSKLPTNATWVNNTYTQTWSGSAWLPVPADKPATMSEDAGVECSYKCNSGYMYEGGACVFATRDADCTNLPANATWVNGTFSQSFNGTSWNPSTAPAPSHSTSGECSFQCIDENRTDGGYKWENNQCVAKTNSVNCSGKPDDSEWVGSSSITQTWSGSAWTPAMAADWGGSAVTNKCIYQCQSGYHREGSSCTSNSRTQSCGSTPAGGIANTVTTTDQTWTVSDGDRWEDKGDKWTPAATWQYSSTASTSRCYFKCESGYSNNGNTDCQRCGDHERNGGEQCDDTDRPSYCYKTRSESDGCGGTNYYLDVWKVTGCSTDCKVTTSGSRYTSYSSNSSYTTNFNTMVNNYGDNGTLYKCSN